jgi:hypothetical protein
MGLITLGYYFYPSSKIGRNPAGQSIPFGETKLNLTHKTLPTVEFSLDPQNLQNSETQKLTENLTEEPKAYADPSEIFSNSEKRIIDQCLSSLVPLPQINEFSDFKKLLQDRGTVKKQFENWEVEHPEKGRLLIQHYFDYELNSDRWLVAKKTDDGIPDILELPNEISINPSRDKMAVYLKGVIQRRESLWSSEEGAFFSGSVIIEERADDANPPEALLSNQAELRFPMQRLDQMPGKVRSFQLNVGSSFLDCSQDFRDSQGDRCHCQSLQNFE